MMFNKKTLLRFKLNKMNRFPLVLSLIVGWIFIIAAILTYGCEESLCVDLHGVAIGWALFFATISLAQCVFFFCSDRGWFSPSPKEVELYKGYEIDLTPNDWGYYRAHDIETGEMLFDRDIGSVKRRIDGSGI